MESKKLFVYGTLMKVFKNEMSFFLQQNASYIGTGEFQGKLYNIGSYPAAISSTEKQDSITGEVYSINDFEKVISILDEYEGISTLDKKPYEYLREKVTIKLLNKNKKLTAWTYIYNWNIEQHEQIIHGNYARFIASK